jgi:hypothetical protein
MSLRSETFVLRVCGNCAHAKGSSEPEEIEELKRAYSRYVKSEHACLALLRRFANHLKDAKVLCQKENTEMCVFEEACAFWKEK